MIDLDVGPVAAPTVRRRPRRRRWPAAVAAAAVALLAGGAAAPQERPWDRPVVLDGVPFGAMTVADDTLYLARPDGVVTAYHAGGGQRWSVRLGEADTLLADAVDDLVLLHVVSRGAGDVHLTVVEAATGVPRWRREGTIRLVDEAAGLVLFGESALPATDPTADQTPPSYRLLELATGREVWHWGTRPADATLVPVRGDDGGLAGLLQRDGAGRTLLLDAVTRQSRPLADPPRATDAYRSGDDLLLLVDDDTGPELVRYDLATLRPRWRTGEPVNELLGRCGPWLCVQGGDGTAALDPATGQVRWRRAGAPAGLGDPLVWPEFGAPAARVTLLDPVSGRPLLELPGWTGIGWPGAGWQVASRWRAQGRNQLVAVQLSSRRVHPVADVVVGVDSCVSSGRLLACRSDTGTLTMWRLA